MFKDDVKVGSSSTLTCFSLHALATKAREHAHIVLIIDFFIRLFLNDYCGTNVWQIACLQCFL